MCGCCCVPHRDADAARVLRDVYRLGSSYSSAPSGMVDLSDTTISRLGSKLTIMRDLKVRQWWWFVVERGRGGGGCFVQRRGTVLSGHQWQSRGAGRGGRVA